MASDVIRDGLALELTDLDQDPGPGPASEIFWSDIDNEFTFSAHRPVPVPMDLLLKFVEEARKRLPSSRTVGPWLTL